MDIQKKKDQDVLHRFSIGKKLSPAHFEELHPCETLTTRKKVTHRSKSKRGQLKTSNCLSKVTSAFHHLHDLKVKTKMSKFGANNKDLSRYVILRLP